MTIMIFLILSVRGSTLVDVSRRQILTSNVGPRTERVNYTILTYTTLKLNIYYSVLLGAYHATPEEPLQGYPGVAW